MKCSLHDPDSGKKMASTSVDAEGSVAKYSCTSKVLSKADVDPADDVEIRYG
jgi:hypothetical protein